MAQDQKKADSVYDFLYIDSKRIALYLSQFGSFGHLTALTKTATDTKAVDGKFDVKIASMSSHETGQTGLSKQYDAQWVAPLTFLDEASQRGMIERDIEKARIGQLFLFSGHLSILDISMLKGAWEKGSVKKLLTANVEAERKKAIKSGVPLAAGVTEMQLMIDLLGIMPHTIQASILNEIYRVWCCLSEASLVGLSSDLVLKHGAYIPGEWNILGVLDALPDVNPTPAPGVQNIDELVASLAGTVLGTMAAQMGPAAREILGRPRIAYGTTPLLIFREISGNPPETTAPTG